MKKFINLYLYELGRAKMFILCLFGGGIVAQTVLLVLSLNKYQDARYPDYVPELIQSMTNYGGLLFVSFFMIAGVLSYVIYIWAREWYGQGNFIYRLLMLPGNRMMVYWAKFATIFSIIISGQGLLRLLIPINVKIASIIVPRLKDYQVGLDHIRSTGIGELVLPRSTGLFFMMLFIECCIVITLFQLILIQAGLKGSLGLKVYGMMMLYIGGIVLFVMAGAWFARLLPFTNLEVMMLVLLGFLLYIGVNILLSQYLLTKKVSV